MEFSDCICVSATAKILADTTGVLQAANIVLKCACGRDLAEKDIHKLLAQTCRQAGSKDRLDVDQDVIFGEAYYLFPLFIIWVVGFAGRGLY